MPALLRQRLFDAKIGEKSHVFWDIDFGRVLEGFWEAKILDFRTLFHDFSKQISRTVSEGQKIETKGVRWEFWAGPAECAEPGGENREGVIRHLA